MEIFIYKTFQEVVEKQLNEDTEIKSITVTAYHYTDGQAERERQTKITNEKIISQILDGFTEMELKKDNDSPARFDRKYSISILTRNEVAEKHYSTESLNLYFNENFISVSQRYSQHFKIISDSNHLEAIESLLHNEEIEWELINNP